MSAHPLEILVSTINRDSLEFLEVMFQNNTLSDYQILVINQTTEDRTLVSKQPKIRVINSFEIGLSKSRNLALEHAIGEIVLIADDDIVYVENFQKTILSAFDSCENAALISFQILNTVGDLYRNYFTKSRLYSLRSVENIMSVEIALNRKLILGYSIFFDTNFGLGSKFETAEEYIFSREVITKGLKAYFYKQSIASHPFCNSGQALETDKNVYARAALHYKLYGRMAYIWLPKYLFFLLRHNYIKFNDLKQKFSIASKGLKDSQSIYKNKIT